MEWTDPSTQDIEQEKPVPPYTRVIATKDFKAEHPHDLPFSKGDRLCILEPCNVIFWYLAEDQWGKRGVIPINFVKAFHPGKEPPVLRPLGKYRTMVDFIQKSGWFTPSVEGIICNKAMLQMPVFQTMKAGVYLFQHKYDDAKKYVGKSYNLYTDLIQLFHRLFEKPEDKLSPIEVELKYHTPDADKWYIRIYPVMNPDLLNLEETKVIVKFRTVQPEGLNTELVFHSKEHWYDFAAWYREFLQRKGGKKPSTDLPRE